MTLRFENVRLSWRASDLELQARKGTELYCPVVLSPACPDDGPEVLLRVVRQTCKKSSQGLSWRDSVASGYRARVRGYEDRLTDLVRTLQQRRSSAGNVILNLPTHTMY